MGKLALCMDRHAAPTAYQLSKAVMAVSHDYDFWQTYTRLIDRDICEKDESTLQLIPYVVLIDDGAWSLKIQAPKVFVYHRGQGGEEGRLHGALSIGLGGHIDGEVPAPMTLLDWCGYEAVRELKEEVGLQRDFLDVHFANAVLCDPNTDVSRVHIGLLATVSARASELGASEAEVVEHGQWLTLDELLAPVIYERLEPWSQAALRHLEVGLLRSGS